MSKWTFAIEENGKLYKITKIFSYSDGEFGVAIPYHSARKGYLGKTPVDYTKREQWIPREEMTEYTASDRVKLSFHLDGFVQFSGKNPGKIISGRNCVSGQIKGLGIESQPLTRPIKSGPTFGIEIWGMSEFEILEEKELQNPQTIIFWEGDFYTRHCSVEEANRYLLEGFVFQKNEWNRTRLETSHNRLQIIYERPFYEYEVPGTVFRLKVIPTGNPYYFISLLSSRVKIDFCSASGFYLSGSSKAVQWDSYGRVIKGEALIAVYPPPMKDFPSMTLDYRPSIVN